ncbi:MAG TPA: RidA family protein [Vicinamibacterales bacterium]|nr:RidA family protein [Vicinamibacterales bacterium]
MRPYTTFGTLVVLFSLMAPMMSAQDSSKRVFPGGAGLPFSAAIRTDGLIYVSGTLGTTAGNTVVSGGIAAQTQQALDNISATLKTAGSSLSNAASVMVYLRSASDFAAMNDVYRKNWPKDPPARTTVVVTAPLALPDALIEVSMVAVPTGGERAVVHPSGWIASPNPYSYGIKAGNTLFMSGLISRNGKDNTAVKGDITAQTQTVLDNGTAILKAAGMTPADVVSARVFIADAGQFQEMNAAYRTYFSKDPPARATVKAGLTSPDYLVEITMVAVKSAARTVITMPNADGSAGTPSPVLSSAIRVGNRLYVAGTLGTTTGNGNDVKAQTTEALARIGRTLKAAGFDWTNVVDGIVYLPDMARFADMNTAYRETFAKDFPARATVGAGLMGAGGLVEIMFTASR